MVCTQNTFQSNEWSTLCCTKKKPKNVYLSLYSVFLLWFEPHYLFQCQQSLWEKLNICGKSGLSMYTLQQNVDIPNTFYWFRITVTWSFKMCDKEMLASMLLELSKQLISTNKSFNLQLKTKDITFRFTSKTPSPPPITPKHTKAYHPTHAPVHPFWTKDWFGW